MRHIELITTGGTIEKTYDEATGSLSNRGTIVEKMLKRLRLHETTVHVRTLMSKDSLELTDADRQLVVKAVRAAGELSDGVVVLHGTDTLEQTGELLDAKLGERIGIAVVLTGAMRPFEMVRTDALQNLTEALLAAKLMPPGVYVAAHGNVLRFPGVVKDREVGTFVSKEETAGRRDDDTA
jgi:L-asparaginase